MQIAIFLYPDMTVLDAIGPYEVLRLAPEVDIRLVAKERGLIRADCGLQMLNAEWSIADVTAPDIVVFPGTPNVEPQMTDPAVQGWVKEVHRTSLWTTSVCTGAFILGAAKVLEGKRATTHWGSLEALDGMGATAVRERVVRDGKIITAAGVSAGIDMALTLVALEWGEKAAQAIQLAIEYDPQPPFESGSFEKATAEIKQLSKAYLMDNYRKVQERKY